MDSTLLVGIGAAIIIFFVLGKVMLVPLRHVIKLILNAIIGGILLAIVNFLGASFSLYVPINIATALIAGFLGVPGIILLVGLKVVLT